MLFRSAKMNLDCILHNPAIANSNVHFIKEDSYDFHLENTLDMKVLMKKFKLGSKAPQSVSLNVSNVDRAFGAIFGSEITRKYGNDLPDDVYTVHCNGAGGQSFGAFIPNGLTLELVGDCNDYMGKGLSGGKIVVRPPQGIDFKPEENIITGNVALYGATSGKAFISGVAGEQAVGQGGERYKAYSQFFQYGKKGFMIARDRKSTRLNSSHSRKSRMPSSA